MLTFTRLLLLLFVLAMVGTGCVTKIGDTRVVFRVASSTPDRIVENVDGQYVMLEGAEPEGRSLFLIMRGMW